MEHKIPGLPDADAAIRRAKLADARALYRTDPLFRELAKEYLEDDLAENPGQSNRNYAQEALIEALDEWEYVEPEQPYHEYLYEQTPEGHR